MGETKERRNGITKEKKKAGQRTEIYGKKSGVRKTEIKEYKNRSYSMSERNLER